MTSQGRAIRYQLLNQPELDDRQETWSARHFTDTPFMTRDKVAASWQHYLGLRPATPYAAPARAADLSGLPPAFIATAEFDPDRDEGIEYGLRLLQAGVPVELHQWLGTFHGSVGGPVSQGVAATDRRARRRPAPGPGRLSRRPRRACRLIFARRTRAVMAQLHWPSDRPAHTRQHISQRAS